MTVPYYNLSYGEGLEGIMNYANTLTDSWLANLFIMFIFLITIFVLGKSEWKMSSVMTYAFFLTLISSILMSVFMKVNGYIIFISVIGLGISVLTGIISKNKY